MLLSAIAVSLLFVWILLTRAGLNADSCSYQPRDCQDVKDFGITTTGVYHVTPAGAYTPIKVYCDLDTDGGGWLLFQRRFNGSLQFNQSWREYQKGFDDPSGEFWLGNQPLRMILNQGYYQLRIDMEAWDGEKRFALYDIFEIGSLKENYTITVDGYSGDAGDAMGIFSGAKFAAYDRDLSSKNCSAVKYKVGWWYGVSDCFNANLNGHYVTGGGPLTLFARGIIWYHWRGFNYSLKATEMKVRRK